MKKLFYSIFIVAMVFATSCEKGGDGTGGDGGDGTGGGGDGGDPGNGMITDSSTGYKGLSGSVKSIKMVCPDDDADTDWRELLFCYDEGGRIVVSKMVASGSGGLGLSSSASNLMATPVIDMSDVQFGTRSSDADDTAVVLMVCTYDFDYTESGDAADVTCNYTVKVNDETMMSMSSDVSLTFNSDGSMAKLERVVESNEDETTKFDGILLDLTYNTDGYLAEYITKEASYKLGDEAVYEYGRKCLYNYDGDGNITNFVQYNEYTDDEWTENYKYENNVKYEDDKNNLNLDLAPLLLGYEFLEYTNIQVAGFYGTLSANLPVESSVAAMSQITTFKYVYDDNSDKLVSIETYLRGSETPDTIYSIEYFEEE